jgi:orotate phosphoribosyltransferase
MTTAEDIAKLLLKIKAVTLNMFPPYRYTSGIFSPIYCDNRLIISYPDKRKIVVQAFLDIIESEHIKFDVVAGTATAGIPHAAWIADRLNKPMLYVRNRAKDHGKNNQIEGKLEPGQIALVIEDLISTGGSSVKAGLALREAGAVVNNCIAIFNYEMQAADMQFSEANIKLDTLSNFSILINVAVKEGYIKEQDKSTILDWSKNPEGWGKKMGYE